MTTGVTAAGFSPKSVQDLLSDVNTALLTNVDPGLDLSAEEPLGQLVGIFVEKLAELWELGSTAYNSIDRDSAEGPQLDNVGGLTGTKRLTASPSYTEQTCVFSQTGTFTVGSLVANVAGQSSIQFANANNISVTFASATYTVTNTDLNTILGTSSSLPVTATNLKFLALVDGATLAPATTLSAISNPVTGWSSTTNPLDAVVGTAVELDTAYRLRQDAEISAVGSGNPDALQADVLQVPGVLQAFVIENEGQTFDTFGNPPHTFQVVIWDGSGAVASNNTVAQTIWDDKPTGIATNGSTSGNAVDSQGNTQVMLFSRATQQLLYLNYTVTMLPGQVLNSTTANAMKLAIVVATQQPTLSGSVAPNPSYLGLGTTVYAEAIKTALMSAGLGVQNISLLNLGFSASPSGTADLSLTQLQIAIADSSRIFINTL